MAAIGNLGAAFKISDDRIADFLRQRQSNLVTPFAQDAERSSFPLNIANAHASDVTGTQPESDEKKNDGAIAPPPQRLAITRSNDAVDLLFGEIAGEFGQTPSGERRHGIAEVRLTKAAYAEIPKHSPHAGDQLFGGSNAALAGPVDEVVVDPGCPPHAWVV